MDEKERINHDAVNNLITLRDAADKEAESLDPGPNYEDLRQERLERVQTAMEAVDPILAKETIPPSNQVLTDEQKRINAAIIIQSHYRGYLDRCKFLEMLYDLYEKDEEERRLRAAQQVEEGELLVANHKLEIDIEDAETAAKNKQRLYETHIITIQRAWRSYQRRQLSKSPQQSGKDEPSSPASRRKSELLNKAQEFADLKKQCGKALPYNAHRTTLLSDSSSEESISSSALSSPEHMVFKSRHSNPFAILSSKVEVEVRLPQLDWTQLDHSIGHPSALDKFSTSGKSSKDSHREDVRKRLAMNTPSEGLYGDVYTRPPSKPYRLHNSAMELYVNDCNEEASFAQSLSNDSDKDLASKQQRLQEEATVAYIQAGPIAKRLIEVEKLAEEPSEIARMLGISTFRSTGESTLSKNRLMSLTQAQLQVVYNAMQNEIERLNEELVEIVVSRDELHMQQDSILVNIEDLQRRIEELSTKHQKKVDEKEAKKSSNEPQAKSSSSTSSRMSRLFRLGKS